MELKPKMTLAEVKAWLEDQGAICRVDQYRIKCVADIDHLRPGYSAAFYLLNTSKGVSAIELTDLYPDKEAAWEALEDPESPAQRMQLFAEWAKEQYILDRNAKVERLEI